MIHGRNLIVSIDGTAIAGAKSCSFEISQEFLKVCSPTASRVFDKIPTTYDWSMSVDCLIASSSLPKNLTDLLIQGTKVLLTFTDGSNQMRAGYAYVKSCKQTGSVDSLAKFSASFESSGELYNYNMYHVSEWEGHEGGFEIDPQDAGSLIFNNDRHYEIDGVQIALTKPSKLMTYYSEGLLAVYKASYYDIKEAITNNDQQYLDEKLVYYTDVEEDTTNLPEGIYTILVSADYMATPDPLILAFYSV